MHSPLIYEYKGSIKFYKKYDTHLANLAGVEYKGYKIGDLPPSFGFVYNKAEDKEGVKFLDRWKLEVKRNKSKKIIFLL